MRFLFLALLVGCGKSVGIDDNEEDPNTTVETTDDETVGTERYDPEHLTVVKGALTEDEWSALTMESRLFTDIILGPDCLNEPIPQIFTWHPGEVEIDGETLTEVGFRKKGFIGSMSWTRPSLKVDSDRFVDKQEFADSTENFTFNNNNQDPTRIHTCMAYYVFRKAGVPAPLCSFATMEVNGEDLGVYTNVQPIKKPFLRQNFGTDDGDLYEGTASDFSTEWVVTFEVKTDESTLDPLQELADALDLDDGALMARLDEILDVDGFITEWAVEGLIGHWDGYAQGSNNYYVYHDSGDGLLHFIPWGADAVYEDPQSDAHYTASLLVQRLWNHPEAQQMYLDEAQRLLDEVWDEQELIAEIDRIEALIEPHLLDPEVALEGIDEVRGFVQDRAATYQAIIDSPPFRPRTGKPKGCIEPIGSVTATFETEWGSLEDDPFAFPTTLAGEVWGQPLNDFYVGSTAGNDEEGNPVLSIVGLDEPFVAVSQVVLMLPDGVQPGTYPVDIAAITGYLVAADLTNPDPEAWVLQGLLGGDLILDEVSMTPGGTVRGSIDAILVPNIFE